MADVEKLRELMLYLAVKGEPDPCFGSVKLNQLLFAIDVAAYLAWQRPVTEAEYLARERGPVPRQLAMLRAEMVQCGDAVVRWCSPFGAASPQERFIALREPRLYVFSGPERALIDEVVERAARSHDVR